MYCYDKPGLLSDKLLVNLGTNSTFSSWKCAGGFDKNKTQILFYCVLCDSQIGTIWNKWQWLVLSLQELIQYETRSKNSSSLKTSSAIRHQVGASRGGGWARGTCHESRVTCHVSSLGGCVSTPGARVLRSRRWCGYCSGGGHTVTI